MRPELTSRKKAQKAQTETRNEVGDEADVDVASPDLISEFVCFALFCGHASFLMLASPEQSWL